MGEKIFKCEQYFPVVLFMLYKLVLALEFVDEILQYDHPNIQMKGF